MTAVAARAIELGDRPALRPRQIYFRTPAWHRVNGSIEEQRSQAQDQQCWKTGLDVAQRGEVRVPAARARVRRPPCARASHGRKCRTC